MINPSSKKLGILFKKINKNKFYIRQRKIYEVRYCMNEKSKNVAIRTYLVYVSYLLLARVLLSEVAPKGLHFQMDTVWELLSIQRLPYVPMSHSDLLLRLVLKLRNSKA